MKETTAKEYTPGEFGHDLAEDGRTLGAYVGSAVIAHQFETVNDAAAADRMISFLFSRLCPGFETWEPGQRPADVPLAPALAEAFAEAAAQ